jgi:cellobiose-specific phosphotransferase system component IIC
MADLTWVIGSIAILGLIILIGIIVILKVIKERSSGYPSQDERTQKITGKAATYALYIGMYSTIAILFMNMISREFYGSYAFEEGYALIVSLLTYSVSFLGLRLFFDRRGES